MLVTVLERCRVVCQLKEVTNVGSGRVAGYPYPICLIYRSHCNMVPVDWSCLALVACASRGRMAGQGPLLLLLASMAAGLLL